jgi:hypothetical protein
MFYKVYFTFTKYVKHLILSILTLKESVHFSRTKTKASEYFFLQL